MACGGPHTETIFAAVAFGCFHIAETKENDECGQSMCKTSEGSKNTSYTLSPSEDVTLTADETKLKSTLQRMNDQLRRMSLQTTAIDSRTQATHTNTVGR